MIKKSLITLAALALAGNLWAGNIQLTEEALELSIDQLILPMLVPGSISVRKCSTCTTERLPLSTRTEFRIGKEAASFADFRTASSGSKAVYVFYEAKTGLVTRMVLDMRRESAGRKTR